MALRLLPIARPCSEPYDDMRGNAQKRFCASCDKHVHDLSARTEEEARALLHENLGRRICVRFAKNSNGTVRFRTAAIAAAAAISLTACTAQVAESPIEDPSSIDHDQGDMVPDIDDRCPLHPDQAAIDDGCPETVDDDAGNAPR